MGKFLTNISLYLGREWNAMWRLDYCPEWPLEAAFLLRCQPPVPISESAAYTTQSIRNNIRQLLFVRRLRVDRPGTMPWMNWSPGLWSLLAFHAPKSHLVLADPMETAGWSFSGPREAGKPLTWDVTVICPLADSYVAAAAREAGQVVLYTDPSM